MDLVNVSHKVSCWKSLNEFSEVKKLIFDTDSSFEDKKKALGLLKVWKFRRGQDAPLGVLCTIILLDVYVKDDPGKEKLDFSILNSLYGSALTKFINFATSFKLGRDSMYISANHLGIDSFLIDLRHNLAHGRQTFSHDVLKYSHEICMKWIKEYYWDCEIDKFEDVDIKDIRYNAELAEQLDEIFSFYDLLAELILKDFKTFDELQRSKETSTERWPLVKEFMKEKNLKNFRQAFKYFTNMLAKIITSREMRLNPKTFFHVMLTKSDLFMKASEMSKEILIEEENSDDDEVEITPMKRPKKSIHHSVVNQFQHLLWHIAKNDYLKLLLDTLLQIYLNQAETEVRRKSARFWIEIILKSFGYYQKYCEFTKIDIMDQNKITPEIKNIYSYQLDADLKNVIIFVGTNMLPSALKYSKENVLQLLQILNENDDDLNICMSLIPHIYPPLRPDQIENMKNLISIKTNSSIKATKSLNKQDKVYTVQDLQENATKADNVDDKTKIWKLSDTNISWSSLPLGYEFMV